MNYWAATYKLAWIAVAAMGVIVLVCVFVPKYNQLQELQRRKVESNNENRRLEVEITELRDSQERFRTDPEFVESVARETGMVKPGETVYRYTNETLPVLPAP